MRAPSLFVACNLSCRFDWRIEFTYCGANSSPLPIWVPVQPPHSVPNVRDMEQEEFQTPQLEPVIQDSGYKICRRDVLVILKHNYRYGIILALYDLTALIAFEPST